MLISQLIKGRKEKFFYQPNFRRKNRRLLQGKNIAFFCRKTFALKKTSVIFVENLVEKNFSLLPFYQLTSQLSWCNSISIAYFFLCLCLYSPPEGPKTWPKTSSSTKRRPTPQTTAIFDLPVFCCSKRMHGRHRRKFHLRVSCLGEIWRGLGCFKFIRYFASSFHKRRNSKFA